MYQAKVYCIIIVALVSILFFSTKKEKNATNKIFTFFLADSLLQLFFDFITVYTVNNMDTVAPAINEWVHRLSYITLAFVGFLTFKYIKALIESELHRKLFTKKVTTIATIPFIISLILLMILPIYYQENEITNYSYGPATYLLYINICCYVVLIIYSLIRFHKILSGQKITAILLALIAEFGAAAYQFMVPTSLLSSFCVTVLVLGFYVTTENPDAIMIEKLKDMGEKAEAANKAKTTFLANMSHEIRTPINTVIGMNEMILRDSNEQNIRDYAADVKCAAKSLLSIINDILDITKIEQGKLAVVSVEYHFASLIYDVYTTINFKAKEKGLDFKIVTIGPLPSVLVGDDVRLKQILINLLNNAVKYTHKGSVTLEIKQVSEDSFFFSVKDTGIGIKEQDIEKLFIPFERIEKERNRNIEGTGIGLNITTQLLKLLGSELNVKSVYGEGSDFFFTLKQEIVDSSPIDVKNLCKMNEAHADHYWISFEAPKAKVLVVDDNDLNRRVFRNLLKQTKIQIDEASSGQECLEKTMKEKYDIIFMDHLMPFMDGVQTLKAMREQEGNLCKDVTIIALTANAFVGAKEFYYEAGFDEFLSKPIDPQKLEETVFSLLDKNLIHRRKKHSTENAAAGENQPVSTLDTTKLPIINGIDWNYAKLHFTDEESLLETLRIYHSAIDKDAKELGTYFEGIDTENGMNDYQVKVHSMKNSAALIGNVQLAGMAMALENAAKNNECDSIRAMHPIFIEKWLGYTEPLSQFAEKDDDAQKKNADEFIDEIKEIFGKIRSAAADMDDETLDEMSKKLDEYSFGDDMAEKIEEVKTQILNFEVEKLTNCDYF